ncbi:hypothetical protein [Pseudomonas fluorescens]|uniref:hypothetical protein n=1 Tax=Pseudomonas fluorescens TaxID=294 RepID=UPI00399026CA
MLAYSRVTPLETPLSPARMRVFFFPAENLPRTKQARKDQRNAARRTARKAKTSHGPTNWRAEWLERLTTMAGLQPLPRGFSEQAFV